MEAQLELAGHANFFPSEPVVNMKDWDLLQTYDHRTLLCTVVLHGSGGVWRSTVAPTSHAMVLLMPSQGFIKHLLKAHPDIAYDELVDIVKATADVYALHP